MEFLCLFCPSFLAIYIYRKIKLKTRYEDLIIKFGLFVLLSNLVCFIILVLYAGFDYQLYLNASPLGFVLKYLVINLVVNYIMAFLLIRVEEKIQWKIKIKVEQNEKK